MTGLIEMMLMKAMSASAAHEEATRRKRQKKADARAITCSVCHTYGGTMYRKGDGYICRDCRKKEQKNDRKTD